MRVRVRRAPIALAVRLSVVVTAVSVAWALFPWLERGPWTPGLMELLEAMSGMGGQA